jgi:hypothetical protein
MKARGPTAARELARHLTHCRRFGLYHRQPQPPKRMHMRFGNDVAAGVLHGPMQSFIRWRAAGQQHPALDP